jgi:hypothetical protein
MESGRPKPLARKPYYMALFRASALLGFLLRRQRDD